jgi:hypothetical protein
MENSDLKIIKQLLKKTLEATQYLLTAVEALQGRIEKIETEGKDK